MLGDPVIMPHHVYTIIIIINIIIISSTSTIIIINTTITIINKPWLLFNMPCMLHNAPCILPLFVTITQQLSPEARSNGSNVRNNLLSLADVEWKTVMQK